jgi:hypothetical protein
MKTIITLTFLSCFFILMSCEPDESSFDYEGIVIWAGEPASDGCGWLININDSTYSPINLGSSYQIDSLNIFLSFNKLDTRNHCGWRQPGYAEIEITKIKN